MDIQPQATRSISDDQELAKVLAGVSQQSDDVLQFEETPTPVATAEPVVAEPVVAEPVVPEPVVDTPIVDTPVVDYSSLPSAPTEDLESIKKDALVELRPLVDKLNLAPEEKFDTYLLLLRSTDDKTLIAPAHAAAQAIIDETRRAQALLDVIKEIDYLSTPKL
ncbi:hypothetical protein H7X68_02145 [Candidatus Saccharibacteria bacterium]|nr:hypothetical protein [Candidatus Saccharibacteria bacterium]